MQASIVRELALAEAVGDALSVPMTIEHFFSAHGRFVWRTLRCLGVAEPDLEDQTQEVFIVAHRRIAECDVERPRAWLYAIARRCAASYRRRSHRRHEQPVAIVPEDADPRDPSARAEVDLLNRVLLTLDEEKREVFLLYEVEEMSMREVAEAVQCPLQTAYTRLYAARRDLTRALEEAT